MARIAVNTLVGGVPFSGARSNGNEPERHGMATPNGQYDDRPIDRTPIDVAVLVAIAAVVLVGMRMSGFRFSLGVGS